MKAVVQDLNELTDSKELLIAKPNLIIQIFLYILLILLLVAGIWAYFGEIDDYVKAKGIIRPNEKVSTIKNVVAGKVIHVDYEEGKRVKQGDVLYTIDHTQWDLDLENTNKELERKTAELNNLRLLRQSYLDGQSCFSSYSSQNSFIGTSIYIKFTNRYSDYVCRVQQLEDNIEHKQEIYNIVQKLYTVSAMSYKDFIDSKYQLGNAKLDLQKYKMETLTQTENEITITETDVDKLQKQINQVNTNIRDAIVKAPIDGVINVVTEINQGDFLPTQTNVITIVPENNSQYKIIIYVNNKDIANITEGQKISYDFLALPYKEYGELTGVVTKVGTDASTEKNTEGNRYTVEATVDNKPVLSYKGEKAELKVGMVCDARIITESKKILYYILEKIDLRE